MNPGHIEEVGKVASGTIEALKHQPLMLALVILQGFVLGAVLYSSISRQNAMTEQFKQVYELLAACIKEGHSS
jgi:hypothetical protein